MRFNTKWAKVPKAAMMDKKRSTKEQKIKVAEHLGVPGYQKKALSKTRVQ